MSGSDRIRVSLTVVLAAGACLACSACCPSVAGPTASAASYSATIEPGELRFYDADTPPATGQINLDFVLDSTTVGLRVRQVEPACLPAVDDSCQSFYDLTMSPRPVGVLRFSSTLQPHGSRTRIVLQNTSSSERLTYTVTITPFRAGCT